MGASAVKVNSGKSSRSAGKDAKNDVKGPGHHREAGPLTELAQMMAQDGMGPSMEGLAGEVASMPLARRQSTVLTLQRTRGNSFVQRLAIQAKLTVGPAGDKYEQEADHVADQVMRMTETPNPVQRQEDEEEIQTKPLAASITPLVQRFASFITSPLQRQAEEEEIQTKPNPVGCSFETGGSFESQLSATRGGGLPLPGSLRGEMEAGFGADFSGVRVHMGSQAADLNRAVSAQAFTHGQDIYMGQNRSNLESRAGKRLIAHELAHVVQQTGSQPFAANSIQRLTELNLLGGSKTNSRWGILVGKVAEYNKSGDRPAQYRIGLLDDIQRQLTSSKALETGFRGFRHRTSRKQKREAGQKLLKEIDGERAVLNILQILEDLGLEGLDKVVSVEELGKTIPQGQTIVEHIKAKVQSYQANFQVEGEPTVAQAMKLVAAITTIAKVIAASLNAPRLRSLIAGELLKANKEKLIEMLKAGGGKEGENMNDENAQETLKLAGALSSDDPVGLYLQHEKISLIDAVWRIRVMAVKAGRKPSEMFDLLSQQYQIEMGAYQLQDIKKGERGQEQAQGGVFDFSDIYGEISSKYFEELFSKGTPKWSEEKGKGLEFQVDITNKLKNLKEKVAKWDAGEDIQTLPPIKPTSKKISSEEEAKSSEIPKEFGDRSKLLKEIREHTKGMRSVTLLPPGMSELTEGQYAYLRKLMQAEEGVPEKGKSPKQVAQANLLKYFKAKIGAKSDEEATEMVRKCITLLGTAPIIISFKVQDIFKNPENYAGHLYKQFFQIFQEQVDLSKYVSGSTVTAGRVKPNALDRGPDYGSWRREKDELAIRESETGLKIQELPVFGAIRTNEWQANLYGDFHFKLKPSVHRRAAYSCGTGKERRDFIMLLADMAAKEGSENFISGMLEGKMEGTDIEIHVYGGVDFTKDVDVIHFPSTIDINLNNQFPEIKKSLKARGIEDPSLEQINEEVIRMSSEKELAAENLVRYANEKGIRCDGESYNKLARKLGFIN
jgi:hypothetical protein